MTRVSVVSFSLERHSYRVRLEFWGHEMNCYISQEVSKMHSVSGRHAYSVDLS
jgi:hypothetical protein